MKHIYLLFFLWMLPFTLLAQDKLNNAFRFTNGIYQNYEEFKKNKPSIFWNDVTSDLIVMEPIHKAKMGNLKWEEKESSIALENIWGFCVNGIPYIKVDDGKESEWKSFAGMQLRGKICYYEFEFTEKEEVEVSAYNPLTKKPFRTGKVVQEKIIPKKIMMDFQTGKTEIYTLEKVKEWIASDEELLKTFETTEEIKRREKLFKFLQIFNDRNPIQIN